MRHYKLKDRRERFSNPEQAVAYALIERLAGRENEIKVEPLEVLLGLRALDADPEAIIYAYRALGEPPEDSDLCMLTGSREVAYAYPIDRETAEEIIYCYDPKLVFAEKGVAA